MIHGRENLAGLYDPWRRWCEWALAQLSARGFDPWITSGLRSLKEQKGLYDDYRAGRRKLPAAPPGRSAHNFGLALDVKAGNGQQGAMMRLLESWGGELVSNDPVHVQYPGFRSALGS